MGEMNSSCEYVNNQGECERDVSERRLCYRLAVDFFSCPFVQGNLAHKKKRLPRTLQYDYAWCPMVVLGGGAVSYERGTPVLECHLFRISGEPRFDAGTARGAPRTSSYSLFVENGRRQRHAGGGQHPTPYTLHPTPYTLDPSPYTHLFVLALF